MVSWQTVGPPSASCRRRPAICCGDQPALRRSVTWVRKPSSAASLRRRCRRRRAGSTAFRGKHAPKPRSPSRKRLRPSSRWMVDGCRPSRRAISPTGWRGGAGRGGGGRCGGGGGGGGGAVGGLDEAEEGAAFVEVEVTVGSGQEAPPRCKPPQRLGIRTSR